MLSFFKPQELLFSQNIVSFLVLHPRLCHIIVVSQFKMLESQLYELQGECPI